MAVCGNCGHGVNEYPCWNCGWSPHKIIIKFITGRKLWNKLKSITGKQE